MTTQTPAELQAPAHWQLVDILSDTHLGEHDPATFAAWLAYVETTPANALLILGDWFEAWLGDDCLDFADQHKLEAQALQAVSQASKRLDALVMLGNRDFLLGSTALSACNASYLHDATVLSLGGAPSQRLLLSHGDAWCTDDNAYMQFRALARSVAWQSEFLSKPLDERQRLVAHMREQSKTAQANKAAVDVNLPAVAECVQLAKAGIVVHGHTHEGASHLLNGVHRHVTCDWHEGHGQIIRLARSPENTWTVARVDVQTA